MNRFWTRIDLASPADFAGADDIITNLAKEREPGDIERTPLSLILLLVLLHCVMRRIKFTQTLDDVSCCFVPVDFCSEPGRTSASTPDR